MKNVEACRSPEIGYGTKIVLIFGIAGPKNPKKKSSFVLGTLFRGGMGAATHRTGPKGYSHFVQTCVSTDMSVSTVIDLIEISGVHSFTLRMDACVV